MLSNDLRALKGFVTERATRLNGHLYCDVVETAGVTRLLEGMIEQADRLEAATVPADMRALPDGVVNLAAFRRPTGGGAA